MRRAGVGVFLGALGVSLAMAATSTAAVDVTAATDSTVVEPAANLGAVTSRIAGADRYDTAVKISQHRFTSTAPVVYLARGDQFGDALVAGTLTDGPVLLTRGSCGAVPASVVSEIARLAPAEVIALGATTDVCDAALTTAAAGRPTSRLGEGDDPTTAAVIAGRAFPAGSGRVYLASGSINPDLLVSGMLKDGPVLLTSPGGTDTPQVTVDAVTTLGATQVIALGGTGAVSDAALATAAGGLPTSRLAGADRYATATAIARHAFPSRTSRVYLARGDGTNYADAAASGMLTDGPVLLTRGPCTRTNSRTAAYLKDRYPSRVVALGGTGALCDSGLAGAALAARRAVNCAVTKCVALTFDDGPSWPTPTLLDTLKANRIPATFFVLGQKVDANPQHTIRTWVEGHEVANHSWNHPEMNRLTRAQQQWQVDATDAELASHGISAPTLMRPPYGAYNATTRDLGFPLILWDVDTRDWDGPPSSATVRERVRTGVRNGSIVLQHDVHNNSVLAVPGIIADLTAMGYTFVTVSELVPGMQEGDLVYRRGYVVPRGTPASPADIVVTEDGRVLGQVVDEAGVEGLAPQRPITQILEGLRP